MDTNYFVCTLGQAAALNKTRPDFKSINHFIDTQATDIGNQPAVGFIEAHSDPSKLWHHHILTFLDVFNASQNIADVLLKQMRGSASQGQTVALLCRSTPEFLFVWLALMRLGHPVLILAPQCQPSAISHLCNTCNVSDVFYDDIYNAQVKAAAASMFTQSSTELNLHSIGEILDNREILELARSTVEAIVASPEIDSTAIAYIHHTSGTSTGLPKPIPQTHSAGVGVLPHFRNSRKATFTTTPLYHGGIADLFRAWTSDSLIWLFPGKNMPITARNIVRCLQAASACNGAEMMYPIKYFSSVPYVLQVLEDDDDGVRYLEAMDIVGVGGAALPRETGDRLIVKGVNLVSRFGSAECGFLLSSHRDYRRDQEWQYLRNFCIPDVLKFEERCDGTSELIVMPKWPYMAKKNRPDGSFATSDLFKAHTRIPNAWIYHSRADSQLTLLTGKKFDPAPLESAIAASEEVADVLIFGSDKPFPGALLFRSEKSAHLKNAELLARLKPVIERLNSESQSHAQIPMDMLIPMSYLDNALEKSSKGTVLRNMALEKYSQVIEAAYSTPSQCTANTLDDQRLENSILQIIESIIPQRGPLSMEDDLFSYGIDSIACMQVRHRLRELLPEKANELPLTIVEDCGTISELVNYFRRTRDGSRDPVDDEGQLMLNLVDQFGTFDSAIYNHIEMDDFQDGDICDVVVLTGATGALGSHILDIYRRSNKISRIYCFVRGADAHAAKERINKALKSKGFRGLDGRNPINDKIIVLQAELSEVNLGLSPQVYEKVVHEATIIMHVAWTVNFRLRLRSFVRDNIAGVRNLINLALRSPRKTPPKFCYCSSIASVIRNQEKQQIREEISQDPSAASSLGYSRSKWVAEQICFSAHKKTRLRGHVFIFRVGQLSGDTKRGIWNEKEAWPLMLSTVRLTGKLPALVNQPLDWLPVDTASTAIIQATSATSQNDELKQNAKIYHILNQEPSPDWMDFLHWLQTQERFEIVTPADWLEALAEAHKSTSDHPSLKLYGLWNDAYGQREDTDTPSGDERRPVFSLSRTVEVTPAIANLRPLDEKYFRKLWNWVYGTMVCPKYKF